MLTVVMIRQPAVKDFLKKLGIIPPDAIHLENLYGSSVDYSGHRLICMHGLPLFLIQRFKEAVVPDLKIPKDLQGCELTLDQVGRCYSGCTTYVVRKKADIEAEKLAAAKTSLVAPGLEEYVKLHYFSEGTREIGERFGVSSWEVSKVAQRLGFRKVKKHAALTGPDLKRVQEYVKTNWQTQSTMDMALALQVRPSEVKKAKKFFGISTIIRARKTEDVIDL